MALMAEPLGEEPTAEARKRTRTLVVAGLLVVVLVVVLFTTLGGGGGSQAATDEPTPVAAGTAPLIPAPAPAPATATQSSERPVETFEVFSPKNPFQPLATAASATPAEPAPAPAPEPPAEPNAAATPEAAAPVEATEPRTEQRVALLGVFADGDRTVANVRVNDTVHEKLAVGDPFGGTYRVVELQGNCGSFLFADDRFQLCEGQEILK